MVTVSDPELVRFCFSYPYVSVLVDALYLSSRKPCLFSHESETVMVWGGMEESGKLECHFVGAGTPPPPHLGRAYLSPALSPLSSLLSLKPAYFV